MGALATAKSTHISVTVPMTGYCLASVFAIFVLLQEGRNIASQAMGEMDEVEIVKEDKLVPEPVVEEIKEG